MYRLKGFIKIHYLPLLLIVRGIEATELGIKGTKGLN